MYICARVYALGLPLQWLLILLGCLLSPHFHLNVLTEHPPCSRHWAGHRGEHRELDRYMLLHGDDSLVEQTDIHQKVETNLKLQ